MEQEIEPSEMDEGALEELEYSYMEETARKVDIENPSWRQSISAIEHKLFGSGVDGAVFHPNLPIAIVAGCSLEQVNQKRREANETKQGVVELRFDDDIIRYQVEYSDLTEEDIKSSEYRQTFKVISGKNLFTEEQVEVPENINDLIRQRMKKGQEEAKVFLLHRPKF